MSIGHKNNIANLTNEALRLSLELKDYPTTELKTVTIENFLKTVKPFLNEMELQGPVKKLNEAMQQLRISCSEHIPNKEQSNRIKQFISPVRMIDNVIKREIFSFLNPRELRNISSSSLLDPFQAAADLEMITRLNQGVLPTEFNLTEKPLLALLKRTEGKIVVTKLELSFLPITNLIDILKYCPHIETLIAEGCELTPSLVAQLASFQDKLKSLKSVNLKNNNLGDAEAIAISSMQNLTHLNLSQNRIGPEGGIAISTMPNLTHLILNDANIGDRGAIAISSIRNLSKLALNNNDIGSNGAIAISTIANLKDLSLTFNKITDAGVKSISSRLNLKRLNLKENNIGDEGAKDISKMNSIVSL
ncbi:MAG: hypothetical protein V4489_03840 [Chlamydiota bacterium]